MVSGNQALTQKYGINATDHRTRLDWVGLSDRDGELIKKAASYLAPEAETIAKEFYDHSYK